jgi:acyl-CoA thioester hydrolase
MTDPALPPSGTIEGRVHRFPVRAYFEDTDLSGVVYHANYLRWFERARTEMLRVIGFEQRAVQEAGEGVFAVAEVNIRYLRPIRLDDAVIIHTSTEQMRAASCIMHQQMWLGDQLMAEARLRFGFISPTGRPCRFPEPWRLAFAALVPEKGPE